MSNNKLVCARAVRSEFAKDFRDGIEELRINQALTRLHLLPKICADQLIPSIAQELLEGFAFGDSVSEFTTHGANKPNAEPASAALSTASVVVAARIRPIHEGYRSLSTEDANSSVVTHDGRLKADGRRMYMIHQRYHLDKVFGEKSTTEDIFNDLVPPLLENVANGKSASLLLFGQTGTGKTYTAFGLLKQLAAKLFEISESDAEVSVFELAGSGGKECAFDMLNQDPEKRKKVILRQDEEGTVHACGATKVTCGDVESFLDALALARSRRLTEATERNTESSRSHCVIAVKLPNGGLLRVVDLAGSERNYETVAHTRAMATRGGRINESLLHLKDCMRVRHLNHVEKTDNHVPYRRSKLVHYLQTCFTDNAHRTVVIGTLSATPNDVDHSRNTLSHITMMRLSAQAEEKQKNTRLHSVLQDARAGMVQKHLAFNMVTGVGGSIMKKHQPDDIKQETFFDKRYHTYMEVEVTRDEWEVHAAACEAVHDLVGREQTLQFEWRERQAGRVQTWTPPQVQSWIAGLTCITTDELEKNRIPKTMSGLQFSRLGRARLIQLCGNDAGPRIWEELKRVQAEADGEKFKKCDHNARAMQLSMGKNRSNTRPVRRAPTADTDKENSGDSTNETAPAKTLPEIAAEVVEEPAAPAELVGRQPVVFDHEPVHREVARARADRLRLHDELWPAPEDAGRPPTAMTPTGYPSAEAARTPAQVVQAPSRASQVVHVRPANVDERVRTWA